MSCSCIFDLRRVIWAVICILIWAKSSCNNFKLLCLFLSLLKFFYSCCEKHHWQNEIKRWKISPKIFDCKVIWRSHIFVFIQIFGCTMFFMICSILNFSFRILFLLNFFEYFSILFSFLYQKEYFIF